MIRIVLYTRFFEKVYRLAMRFESFDLLDDTIQRLVRSRRFETLWFLGYVGNNIERAKEGFGGDNDFGRDMVGGAV